MMTTNEVLDKLLEYTGENCSSLAVSIGLKNRVAFYDIRKGKYNFSLKIADAICARYPNINKGWLLTGDVPVLKEIEINEKVLESTKLDEELVDDIPLSVKSLMRTIVAQQQTINYLLKRVEELEGKKDAKKTVTA